MAESIKLTDGKFIDATGVYDSSVGKTQNLINEEMLGRVKIISVPQANGFTLRFSGYLKNTRSLAFFMIPSGQSGIGTPISASFDGNGGPNRAENCSLMVSTTESFITIGTGYLHVSSGYFGDWGNFTLIVIEPELQISIEY